MRGGGKLRVVKEIQGTLRKHQEKNNPDTLILSDITPPRYLTESAKKVWNDVSIIIRAGTVKMEHTPFLAVFCNEMADYWQLQEKVRELEKRLPIGEDPDHDKKIRLLRLTQKEKLQGAIRIGQDFGLTPISGQRIDIIAPTEIVDDPMDYLCLPLPKANS